MRHCVSDKRADRGRVAGDASTDPGATDRADPSRCHRLPDLLNVPGTDLLVPQRWLPEHPIPLDEIELRWAPDTPFGGVTGDDELTAAARPDRADGTRYPTYPAAVAALAVPSMFERAGPAPATG